MNDGRPTGDRRAHEVRRWASRGAAVHHAHRGPARPAGERMSDGVTVALGGGGAKCYAQIGVLQALDHAGIPVRGLACTSAGGLVGAAYAAGLDLGELERAFVALQRRGGPRPALRGRADSLFDLDGSLAPVRSLFGDMTFEDLSVPLALTAIDAASGRPVTLDRGPVMDALRAAVAIPGLFPPEVVPAHGERPLLDGGVVDPVPVATARRLAPGYPALAVVLQPQGARWEDHPVAQRLSGLPMLRWIAVWRVMRALAVFIRAAEITHRELAEARLALDRPDLVVRPSVPHVELFDHALAQELVERGRLAMEAELAACGPSR